MSFRARTIAFGLVILLATISQISVCLAEKRVALVIGNGAYKNAPKLPNPINDATDVSVALKALGFDVDFQVDLDRVAMDEATIRFERAARVADVAMFYYSGHAMQFAGVNYLAPIDASLHDEADLRRLIKVDDVLSDLRLAKNLRILVLDSCRDNPLVAELKRSIGRTRSAAAGNGLAKIEGFDGTIISYSTQSGSTAEDGAERNSPYTAAFLKHIQDKDEIATVFHRISGSVYNQTAGSQTPELSISFFGEFYLNGKFTITVPAPSAADPCANAGEHWKSAEAIGSRAALEDHLVRYPQCGFAGLAKAKLEVLRASDDKEKSEAELKFWRAIPESDEAGYREYLNRYPGGAFAPDAQKKLAAIKLAALSPSPPLAPEANATTGKTQPCSSERRLKSIKADSRVSMTFRNQSSEAISAYWLNYDGKRVLYQRIPAGGSFGVDTFISHPWVLATDTGECRTIVMPDQQQRLVSFRQ